MLYAACAAGVQVIRILCRRFCGLDAEVDERLLEVQNSRKKVTDWTLR